MEPITAILVALLTAPAASLATWFFNRRKDTADIFNSISEAGKISVDTVSNALEVVNKQLEEVRSENAQLHTDICELKDQNIQLMKENELLRKDLRALKKQNEALMEQIHDMRIAYEQNNHPTE